MQLPNHYLHGKAICVRCIPKLRITGCQALVWPPGSGNRTYVYTLLGSNTPPDDWAHGKPSAKEILKALGSDGYLPPRATVVEAETPYYEGELERINQEWLDEELRRLLRDELEDL